MYEISKHLFKEWVNTIDIESLTDYEITIISIIISNFDKIAASGTAGGARAKLLGKYIEGTEQKTKKTIPILINDDVEENRFIKIHSLDVENFRGFGAEQNFKFETQYTFFHGRNGSGKTSFCEALEYSSLGTIEEATARRIPLDKYIVHAGKKKACKPRMICEYPDGSTKECIADYSAYRFGFIEKNRIEGFSHIGAVTAKTQLERMAALFGLSEFQEFVKGFTVSLDSRYLLLEEKKQEVYKSEVDKKRSILDQIEQLKKAEGELNRKLSDSIAKLERDDLKDASSAIKYLSDTKNGVITRLTAEAEKSKLFIIKDEEFANFKNGLTIIVDAYNKIVKDNGEILADVSAFNFSALYNAVIAVRDNNSTICPVCKTPIENTVVNPYEHATSELEKLKRIESINKDKKENAGIITKQYPDIYEYLKQLISTKIFGEYELCVVNDTNLQGINIEAQSEDVSAIFTNLVHIKALLDNEEEINTRISNYNKNAQSLNEGYDDKIESFQKIYKEIIETQASIKTNKESKEKLISDKKSLDAHIIELKEEVDIEKKIVRYNTKMVKAYDSVVKKLTKHVTELPVEMAANLSAKIIEYYNFINEGDADFELISRLSLPLAAEEKIVITMVDGISQDALQILSEGHVRILGLSILLAKALYEHSPFLIFDDIVNSIDDDHRDGVARLLITHPDFEKTQMILTCHGEVFVSKLEDYVKNEKDVKRYMFLPADSLEERGAFIKHLDATVPLKVAKEKYDEDSLKDAAAKCRQAVECITGKLWKKIAPYTDGGISIQLRGPEANPDLHSVTTSLCKATKKKYVDGIDEIHSDLEKLLEKSMWDTLNKGTHIDGKIPEFSRVETKKMIELLEKLSNEVQSLKVKGYAI